MNIKRAFLTAVAVLLVPGFAMAQSAATFETTLFSPDTGTDKLTVNFTCNAGSNLSDSFDLAHTEMVTFTNDLGALTADCTISAVAPAGYESTVCSFTGVANGSVNVCDIGITPLKFDFEVEVEFDDSAADATGDVTILLTCENVVDDGGSLTTLNNGFSVTAPNDDDFLWADVGVANDEEDSDGDPINVTKCMAEATAIEDSTLEVSSCSATAEFGDEEISCTMVGSVFFEGIPTLSQYGMAIMALLMLAVGFVGFRRFV